MLYRTLHNSFLLPFTPFSHSPSSHSHFLPLSSPQRMEGLNLKAGQEMVEEFVSGDDLFVDELLDFSELEEEQEQPSSSPAETVTEEGKGDCCVLTEEKVVIDGKRDDFGGVNGSELNVEAEGLESLEWLSHFVDDSFPDYSLAGKFVPEKKPELTAPAQEQPCFTTPLQTKARTKRARTGVRVWPVLSPSPVESSTSSISSSSSTNSFPPPSLWAQPADPRPAKKPKKIPAEGGAAAAAAQPRKCSHCGVTKTPQWRAGPLGSKTLCNACGVRFKSGRLLPEYRPACSPTFSSELHSNNHRKVLEMRRQKETETGDDGPLQPVQSF